MRVNVGWSILAACTLLGCGSDAAPKTAATAAGAGASAAGAGASGASTAAGGTSAGGTSSTSTAGTSTGGAKGNPAPPPVHVGDCTSLPAKGTWQNVSPPNSNYAATYTGTNAVVVRPDNPSTIFVGADTAGIFRSDDCGSTWTLVNTGMNAAALSTGRPWSMVIDPFVPDVMYCVQGYGTSGLWKTTNAGVDWTQIFTSNVTDAFSSGGQITSIALDPSDHTHLVAESHGGGMGVCDGQTCLAESMDSGATWAVKTIPQPWAENSAVVLLSTKTWLYTALFGALYGTVDQGATWNQLSDADATANYYEPYVWQDSAGSYYLPSLQPGVLKSAPNDVTSWTPIPNAPVGTVLFPSGSNLYMGNEFTLNFFTASQSDPSTWTSFPGPPHAANSQGGAAAFMNYDSAHHILYSSDFNQGLWRVVVD